MVDEVHTGGGSTGTMWTHEQFSLDSPPDIVSFSKKMFTGGYFYSDELSVDEVKQRVMLLKSPGYCAW